MTRCARAEFIAALPAVLGRLGDRRSDAADDSRQSILSDYANNGYTGPVEYLPGYVPGASRDTGVEPSRLTPINVPDPPLGTPPSSGPSATPARNTDTAPSRPQSTDSSPSRPQTATVFTTPNWSAVSNPAATQTTQTPASATPSGITPQAGYNAWTGVATPLTPVQSSVVNAVGREQLNNRAAQEAIATEAERLGAERGLNVDCNVVYESGPQSYLYQTLCSVNGSPYEYGGDRLIYPGGLDSAAVSRGLPLQTGGGSAGAVPGSRPGGTVTSNTSGNTNPPAASPGEASLVDQVIAQAKDVPWYGWAGLAVVLLFVGRSN